MLDATIACGYAVIYHFVGFYPIRSRRLYPVLELICFQITFQILQISNTVINVANE